MTMTEPITPLEELDMSDDLVRLLFEKGGLKAVIKTAEDSYRMLAKVFHPDSATGDEDKMDLLGQAIEELRDEASLEYYVGEVTAKDREGRERRRVLARMERRQGASTDYLLGMLGYTNQFEQLGITQPTSFLTDSFVVDVLTPNETRVYMQLDSLEGSARDPAGIDHVFRDGQWFTRLLFKKKWEDEPVALRPLKEGVRVVGTFQMPKEDFALPQPSSTQIALGPSTVAAQLSWSEPSSTWYMSLLSHQVQPGHLVLYSQGLFADCGLLMGKATM